MDSNKLQLWRRLTTLDNVPFILLTILLILVPGVFHYSAFLSFLYVKALVVSLGVLLTLIISILAVIKRGSLFFPKTMVAAALSILVLVILIASIFSTSRVGSFLGYGYEVGTFSFLLVMAVLTYLVSVTFTSGRKLLAVNTVFLVFAGILGLFHTLRFFFGAQFLSLGVFDNVISNTVGKVNELSIFFGVSLLLSLFALEILKLNKLQKVFAYVVLLLSLFVMTVVNFILVWYVVGIIAVIFFIYTAAHSTVVAERLNGMSDTAPEIPKRRIAIKSLIVAIIALVFVLPVGNDIGVNIGTKFGVSNVEIRPSWSATYDILKASLKADPLLGAGPNRFGVAWQLYRPDLNLTNFWNTNFDYGVGLIPTYFVETGILGALAWLGLMISVFWLGLRALFSSYADRLSRYLVTSSLAASAFLWAMNVLYAPTTVIVFITFFFTGLFVASAIVARISSAKTFVFIKYPKIGFLATMFGVIILVASAGLGYAIFEQGRSSIYFQKALAAAAQTGDVKAAESNLLNAIRLSKRDVYYRSLAQLNLAQVNALIAAANNSQEQVTEEQRNVFQTHIANAVEASRLAQVADPLRVDNQLMVAQVYATIVPIGIEGSYEAAKTGYEEALKLSPQNPGIYLALAQLAAAHQDLPTAQQYVNKSLEAKSNYIDAIFFQAQLDATQGNLSAAIKRVEQIAALTPDDPLVFFRLGLLDYDAKDYKAAISAFEKSISLVPVYANAKYFLGLSYANASRQADALKVFEELKAENPTNTELDSIITNLKANRAPFASAPVVDAKPEKRKTLPVSETN